LLTGSNSNSDESSEEIPLHIQEGGAKKGEEEDEELIDI